MQKNLPCVVLTKMCLKVSFCRYENSHQNVSEKLKDIKRSYSSEI